MIFAYNDSYIIYGEGYDYELLKRYFTFQESPYIFNVDTTLFDDPETHSTDDVPNTNDQIDTHYTGPIGEL